MTTKLSKRENVSPVVRRRRRDLARVSAASGFFGSVMSMAAMAVILFVAGSLHVPLWVGIVFCISVSTLGGWWFGKQGGRFLKGDKENS